MSRRPRRLPDPAPVAGAAPIDALAQIRHDLRTPAAHIQGYAEMLQEEAAEAGLQHLLPDLKHIEMAGRRLVELIREELSPERIARRPINLRHLHAELRTPLNHVVGYAEILLEAIEERGGKELRRDLQKVHEAAATFLERMEEVLVPGRLGLQAAAQAVVAQARPEALALSRDPLPGEEQPPEKKLSGTVLVVDDDASNRDLLSRRLLRQGFRVLTAADGASALRALKRHRVDLVLLDLLMPKMPGDQVLARLKADPATAEIPVIILSALDEMDSVVRCILMGAEDYLAKPFNPVLLRARLSACLEKRRLRQQERAYLKALEVERQKSETLLLNILPQPIADRLKLGETTIVDSLAEVTVLFADLVGFTSLTSRISSVEMVRLLDDIFSEFDTLAEEQRLEKIKTIGDAYMVVGGLPTPRADHAEAVAELALNMLESVRRRFAHLPTPIELRLGINTGPVIAGIIGRHKFNYDLWGDTVNMASRMESHSAPGKIQVTETTYHRLAGRYRFVERGLVEVKGKGPMPTWFLTGRHG